jgi:hypothetical protein
MADSLLVKVAYDLTLESYNIILMVHEFIIEKCNLFYHYFDYRLFFIIELVKFKQFFALVNKGIAGHFLLAIGVLVIGTLYLSDTRPSTYFFFCIISR